ncbi:MAG: type II toxin-antitoxin system RelE/ParE family toxin [Chitinophagaceae bacterium]
MPFAIEIKEEAKTDIADAMTWYAAKAENLDIRFITAVEDTLIKIQNTTTAFKKIYKQFRQTSIKSFPYVIVYQQEKNTVLVYAVFNTRQYPKKKLKRIKK